MHNTGKSTWTQINEKSRRSTIKGVNVKYLNGEYSVILDSKNMRWALFFIFVFCFILLHIIVLFRETFQSTLKLYFIVDF